MQGHEARARPRGRPARATRRRPARLRANKPHVPVRAPPPYPPRRLSSAVRAPTHAPLPWQPAFHLGAVTVRRWSVRLSVWQVGCSSPPFDLARQRCRSQATIRTVRGSSTCSSARAAPRGDLRAAAQRVHLADESLRLTIGIRVRPTRGGIGTRALGPGSYRPVRGVIVRHVRRQPARRHAVAGPDRRVPGCPAPARAWARASGSCQRSPRARRSFHSTAVPRAPNDSSASILTV